MLRFIRAGQQQKKRDSKNFNTSHVTVYRNLFWKSHDTTWFQYISCYGLSERRFVQTPTTIHHFNTSHVTVYLSNGWFNAYWIKISIHLMLRFICMGRAPKNMWSVISIHLMLRFITKVLKDKSISPLGFQYISCYGLSCRNTIQGI